MLLDASIGTLANRCSPSGFPCCETDSFAQAGASVNEFHATHEAEACEGRLLESFGEDPRKTCNALPQTTNGSPETITGLAERITGLPERVKDLPERVK